MRILGWMSQRFWFNKLGTRPRTLHFWQAPRWFWDKRFANLPICLMWCLWDLPSTSFFFLFPTSNHKKKTEDIFPPCFLSFTDTSFPIKKTGKFEKLLFIFYFCLFSYTLFLNNKMSGFFSDIFFSSLPVRLFFSCNFHTPPWFFFSCYQKFIISLIKQFIKLIWILNSPQRITDSYSECIYK